MKKSTKNDKHFYFDTIGSRPSRGKNDIPIWCDFVELLCLITPGKFTSRGEVRDAAFEGKEFIPQEDDNEEPIYEVDELIEDNDIFITEGLANQRSFMGSNHSRVNDNKDRVISDWFGNLVIRANMFSELYPFIVNEQEATISVKTELTNFNKLYIYLLLAGSLKLFSPKLSGKITTDFEFICLDAQTKLFPLSIGSVVGCTHFFGKNPEAEGIFTGSLSKKFQKLAEKIKSLNVDVSRIPPNNTADRGIDIISFLSFENDAAFGIPIILSQCACSYEDWKNKQYDHHPEKYRQLSLFDVDYIRFMFIPFFYRDHAGQWFKPIDVSTVVIDRLRLMRILSTGHHTSTLRAREWAELVLLEDEEEREYYAKLIIERSA